MNPDLPSGNQASFFGVKASRQGINVNNASDNQLIYKNDYNTTLYYNPVGIPTVLLGLRASNGTNGLQTSEQGLFVSESGIDVTQATDSQMIFNTQDTLKIALSGTVSGQTTDGDEGLDITVEHNLGYIPAAIVFALPPPTTNFSPLVVYPASGGGFVPVPYNMYVINPDTYGSNTFVFSMAFELNNTAIIFHARQGVTGLAITTHNVSFTYYILAQTAN